MYHLRVLWEGLKIVLIAVGMVGTLMAVVLLGEKYPIIIGPIIFVALVYMLGLTQRIR